MAETDFQALLLTNHPRLFYRFSLAGYPSEHWSLARVIKTANDDSLRATTYLWHHNSIEELAISMEILECPSVRHARGYAKGFRSRNSSPREIPEGKETEFADNDLVKGTGFSRLDMRGENFLGVDLSRHNLAFEIKQVTSTPMLISDLGDLEPMAIATKCVEMEDSFDLRATLKPSVSQLKAGDRCELVLNRPRGDHKWYIIISDYDDGIVIDSAHGGIEREGHRIWYHTTEDHPRGKVTFYFAGFNHRFRKGTGRPVSIEIVD